MFADLILENGPVITIDGQDTVATAAAAAGNKIIYVGDPLGVDPLKGPATKVIDLAGRCLIPGFIDAHCHLGIYAASKLRINCKPAAVGSIEALKQAVADRAKTTPTDEWITGWGYDQTEMTERRHPTRWDLDEAAPNHKVGIFRTCGHLVVANSKALADCGYDRTTPDPEGGKLERDETGRLTGLLIEQPRTVLWNKTIPTAETFMKAWPLLNRDFLAYGITSAGEATGRIPHEIGAMQDGVAQGLIQFRIYFSARWAGKGAELGKTFIETGLKTGFGTDRFKLGWTKMMQDGSVGGCSAALRAPYPGQPDNTGICYFDQAELDDMVLTAHRAGWQVGIHAIGDKAVEQCIEAYEKALTAYPRENHRHRIEHYGILDEAMMDKTKELGLVPVMGVPFIYELGDSYINNLTWERTTMMYPLKSLIKRGIIAPLSTDAPVIDPNPMHGLYVATTRKTKTGQLLAPGEEVTMMEALRAYTAWGAYASFEENLKGTIEVGKLADLAVLSTNILEAKDEEILKIKTDLTVIDGQVVYQRD